MMRETLTAREMMDGRVHWVSIGHSVKDAVRIMDRHDVDFLPVVAGGTRKLLGAVERSVLTVSCPENGHDPDSCGVDRHLRGDVDFCFYDDRVGEIFGTPDGFGSDARSIGRALPVIVVDEQKVPVGLLSPMSHA